MKTSLVYIYVLAKGDFVHCNWCDAIMMLPCGADKCPRCHTSGCLVWQEGDDSKKLHEVYEEQVRELNYEIQICPELQEKDYLEGEE